MLIEFHDDSPRIEMEYLMDRALKQRLVGASVLIAVAVLVLPMLLSGRPENKNQQTQKIQIPPQPPELSFETRRYPIGDKEPESPLKQENSGQDKPVRQLPAPRSAPVKVEVSDTSAELPDPVSPETVSPEAISSDTVSSEPDSSGEERVAPPEVSKPVPAANESDHGRYVVQVASFGSLDNATRLSTSLKSGGYPVMTDSVKSAVGKLHRVRIGPYASEAEANRAALELEAKIDGVKPRVMDLQPEKSAQVTTPSDPLVRWVVQVGSFSSAENANRLVASLRLDDLSAYQETVTSSGSSIFRVRVGPFLERNEAIKVERRVREEMSLNGVVMSAE
jgi:DedD protein